MAGEIVVTHSKISGIPSDGDTTYVQGPDWDAPHAIVINPTALTAAINLFTTLVSGSVPASGAAATYLKGDGSWSNAATLTAFLNVFTTIANGLVPASSSASVYLKGDGSWSNAATLTAFLNAFTSSLKGLVPASGGGAINFLRADGVWKPAGLLNVQVISAASVVYAPTADTTRAIVLQQAAGGGGGGANSTTGVAASGGGSSGMFQVCLVGIPGTILTGGACVNGVGGAGGPVGGSSGLLGGDASLTAGGTTMIAKGGGPGFGCGNVATGSFNIAPSSAPQPGTTPGAALLLWPASFSFGQRGEVLSNAAWQSGSGGSNLIGTGGGGVGTTNPGNNGIAGGGGSGASSSAGGGVGQVGGNGGNAIHIIIEFA